MNKPATRSSFSTGMLFVREHPQVWVTALTGILIFCAFIFTAYQFASVAQNAQEELVNVRIGSILDTFVVFAPDSINDQALLRSRIQSIRKDNPTIDTFMVIAPHGTDAWRAYLVDGGGAHEGSVLTGMLPAIRSAYADSAHAYTSETVEGGERYFTTARAILSAAGQVQAVAVTTQKLAEADRQIAVRMTTSYYLLAAILCAIMFLFFRHARILDFAQLYKRQVEIDELKDSFLGMASHELKSPLTVIRGYIEYLEEGNLDEGTRKEYLHRIALSADELRQLIDDILDVSRIEMGRLRFAPDYVRPTEVMREVVDMFKETAQQKNIPLTLDVPVGGDALTVRLDRGRLKQIIVNLTSNALKYTLAGSVRLHIAQVGDRVEISVHDSGVGMTAAESQKLFTKFYRVEAEETRAVSGTGLGLWITKYMTEHMQGTITVESIKGQGSRFVVGFPHQKEPHIDTPPRSA